VTLVEQLAKRLSLTAVGAPPADGIRRAAVAALLHDTPERTLVLMMKRAEREGDPWSGHISLPGGGFHANEDPDLLATSIRETHEELGFLLDRAQLLGNLEPLGPRTSGPTPIEVTAFVFQCSTPPEIVCGPEALAAFWLPLDAAVSGALDKPFTYPNSQMILPSWDFEGHVIWGLTKRILDDLVAAAG